MLTLREFLIQFIFCEIGIISVWASSFYGRNNSVTVCAGLSIIVSLVMPKYSVFFLSASLAGVMSGTALHNIGFVILSGFFVFLLNNLCKNIFVNYGGKPGTLAYFSNMLSLLFCYLIKLSKVYDYDIIPVVYNGRMYESLNVWIYVFGPFFSSISCSIVHFIAYNRPGVLDNSSRVFAYACSTLIGCFYLTIFTTSFTNISDPREDVSYGNFFLFMWHSGCLGGLSFLHIYKDYLPKLYYHHYMFSGYMAGWFFIGLCGVMNLGGKHGFCGFLGNNVYIITVKMISGLCCRKNKVKEKQEDVQIANTEKEVIEEQKRINVLTINGGD